jgi:hypothetical protein
MLIVSLSKTLDVNDNFVADLIKCTALSKFQYISIKNEILSLKLYLKAKIYQILITILSVYLFATKCSTVAAIEIVHFKS